MSKTTTDVIVTVMHQNDTLLNISENFDTDIIWHFWKIWRKKL